MKIVLITLALFIFGGCTVTKPHVLSYRIAPLLNQEEIVNSSCKEKSLKISQVFTSRGLKSKKMYYAESGYKEFKYTESGWSNTPNKAIGKSLLASIRASGLFANVSSASSRSKSDLYLETTVEEFIQFYDMEKKRSHVEVRFSFSLINLQDNTIVDSKVVNRTIETDTLNAEGGVTALNQALTEVLSETNEWLSKACK